MKTKSFIGMLLAGICVSTAGWANQPPQKGHVKNGQFFCSCGNAIVKFDYKPPHEKLYNADCAIYISPECEKCGTAWKRYLFLSGPRTGQFEHKPILSAKKKNVGNKIHKAVKDSCYSVEYFEVPSRGVCECTIKLKLCDHPLYCTVEGETEVLLVERGHPVTYSEKDGKCKIVTATHKQPAGGTPIRRNSK
ncbi:MAG: hypothetical protein IJS63_03300 [Bacteroidaceae bacterium]|nr:hypothetical protein [Bacteroidaceae bacterium]